MVPSDELISEELRFINLKLDQFADVVDETNNNVSKLKDALYHPDNGIYARIKNNESCIHDTKKEAENVSENLLKITQSLKPIASDYEAKQKNKAWSEKIIYAILAAIIAFIVPIVYKEFVKIQADAIEQKDKR